MAKEKARKNPTKRNWLIRTGDTYMIHARAPLELHQRLRRYVESTMYTITDTIIEALDEYLTKHGY